MFVPIAATHTSIASATWTKITTLVGDHRKYLRVVNEDTSNTWRIALVEKGGSAPTGATAGFPLARSAAAGPDAASVYEEFGDKRSSGDVYAYQASGGALATLGVVEGS